MDLPQKVALTGLLGMLGIMGGVERQYGSRGETDVENFFYQGQPSAIVRVDERFAPDRYYIRIGEWTIINDGKLVSDEGRGFSVEKRSNDYIIGAP